MKITFPVGNVCFVILQLDWVVYCIYIINDENIITKNFRNLKVWEPLETPRKCLPIFYELERDGYVYLYSTCPCCFKSDCTMGYGHPSIPKYIPL